MVLAVSIHLPIFGDFVQFATTFIETIQITNQHYC